MPEPDVFALLEQISTQEAILALQEAGAGDHISMRSSYLDVIIAAREWAVTDERREALRRAIERFLGLTSPARPKRKGGPAAGATGGGALVRTVVAMDLVGYSRMAREIDGKVGPAGDALLLKQIQSIVDAGLAAIRVSREQAVFHEPGDSAMLALEGPELAHRFARAVHEACRDRNAGKTVESASFWFRIGAATGEVVERRVSGRRAYAGITLTNAARLEQAGAAGQLLCDPATYGGLPRRLQRVYGKEEVVRGKRDERFRARRCVMVPLAGNGPPPPPEGHAEILDLCPRCAAEVRRLAADTGLAPFLRAATKGDFMEKLSKAGASEVLYGICDELQVPSVGLPGPDELRPLLAGLAPLTVAADFVRHGRAALQLNDPAADFRGGVLEISLDTEEGADAILRGALYDAPCTWSDASYASGSWPRADHTINAIDVPARGASEAERTHELRSRILQACQANNLDTARDAMKVWLRTRAPLSVVCDGEVVKLVDGVGSGIRELALFLSKCQAEHSNMRTVLEQLRTVLERAAPGSR